MPLTRRDFVKGMGAAAGALGLGAKGYPNLIPFVEPPDDIVPGVSSWFATSCRECPAGCGMVVRNREAHIVKCEGNPIHPINRGTLCARGQAFIQGLYDPDRVKTPLHRNGENSLESVKWDKAIRDVGKNLKDARGRIALISDLQTGSLESLMRSWAGALGSPRFLMYEPLNYEYLKAASGQGIVPVYNIATADYLLSIAADFLETWVSPVEYARQFARMRRVTNGTRGRFVYIGPRVSMTAANADVRVIVPAGTEGAVAYAIASLAGRTGGPAGLNPDDVITKLDLDERVIREVAEGFANAGSPLALGGGGIEAARAANALNGGTSAQGRPHALSAAATTSQMDDLVAAMEDGDIDVLIVYGANPVFSYTDPKRFSEALKHVKTIISLSSFNDETTRRAHWILPSHHPLESWGDYIPQNGMVNLLQPTMGPVFNTRQTGDTLIDLARAAGVDAAATFNADNFYSYLRRRWGFPVTASAGGQTTDMGWENLVRRGGSWPQGQADSDNSTPSTGYNSLFWNVDQPASAPAAQVPAQITPSPVAPTPQTTATAALDIEAGKEIRLWMYPSIYLYDGRGANKRWLQELPEPVTKGAWSSWAELHPDTAKRLGVGEDELIDVVAGDYSVRVPVYIWRGVHKNTIALPIGEGHSDYGRFAEGVGVNTWRLAGAQGTPVSVRIAGGTERVITWRGSELEQGRDIVQVMPLGGEPGHGHITMPLPEGYDFNDFYPGHEHTGGNRWALVVDLNRCIGCNACAAACYAENNLAVVGADGIYRGREMAWLRIDRYIEWSRESAPIVFQPMLCQHCDAAPCEPVCPVYAAVHSEDGINEQIYNRCVGTRYCSNNCPYKVRKFNWFDYKWPEPLNYQLNPDVSVRSRGVMEKCTFCVQRIRQARIVAKREGRPIRDGEITPACVQTCPTGVYTFGDLLDPESRVSKMVRSDPRAYQVLHELNTKPAVIYLERIIEGR